MPAQSRCCSRCVRAGSRRWRVLLCKRRVTPPWLRPNAGGAARRATSASAQTAPWLPHGRARSDTAGRASRRGRPVRHPSCRLQDRHPVRWPPSPVLYCPPRVPPPRGARTAALAAGFNTVGGVCFFPLARALPSCTRRRLCARPLPLPSPRRCWCSHALCETQSASHSVPFCALHPHHLYWFTGDSFLPPPPWRRPATRCRPRRPLLRPRPRPSLSQVPCPRSPRRGLPLQQRSPAMTPPRRQGEPQRRAAFPTPTPPTRKPRNGRLWLQLRPTWRVRARPLPLQGPPARTGTHRRVPQTPRSRAAAPSALAIGPRRPAARRPT